MAPSRLFGALLIDAGTLRDGRKDLVLTLSGVVAGLVAGLAIVTDPLLGAALTVALVSALVLFCRPALFALVAVVGLFAAQRLGGTSDGSSGATGISYSDALLVAASALAVAPLLGRAELRRLRPALLGLAVYLACLLPTLFLNSSAKAGQEWVHRLVLVGGALVVGAWLTRDNLVRTVLRCLVVTATLISVVAVLDAVRSGFAPASPLGLNKNFVGEQVAMVLIVLIVADRYVGLSRHARLVSIVMLAGGLLASQSRGGMLAAAVGLLIAFALDPRAHSRAAKTLAVLIGIGLAAFVYVSVSGELSQNTADRNNNSIGVRFNVERVTLEIWRTSEVNGVGLKYFNTGLYGQYATASNNAVDNELAESGLIGLAGFVVLQGAVLVAGVRRHRGDHLTIAATACVAGLLVHGMVDIYWTAGVVPLPFLLLGMALARHHEPEAVDDGNAVTSRIAVPAR